MTVSTVFKKLVPGERASTANHLDTTPVGGSCLSAKFTHQLHLEDAATKHILFTILRLSVQSSSVVVNSCGRAVKQISNTALLPIFLFVVLPSWF